MKGYGMSHFPTSPRCILALPLLGILLLLYGFQPALARHTLDRHSLESEGYMRKLPTCNTGPETSAMSTASTTAIDVSNAPPPTTSDLQHSDDCLAAPLGIYPVSHMAQAPNVAVAVNRFSCRTSNTPCTASSPGFSYLYATLSAQKPILISGESWNDHYFVNGIKFSHPAFPNACSGSEFFSVGVAYGTIEGQLVDKRIVVREGINGQCRLRITPYIVEPPGAITLRIARSMGDWKVSIWTGKWEVVATYQTTWAVAAEVDAGQERWSRDAGRLNRVNVPLSFIHNLTVAGTSNVSSMPWSNLALVPPLSGAANSTVISPLFHSMDGVADDFTAISTCVNLPCY